MTIWERLFPRKQAVVQTSPATGSDPDGSELPDMDVVDEDDLSLGERARLAHERNTASTLVGSTQAGPTVVRTTAAEEGLPAVNRNRGGNRLVAVIGVVVAVIVASAFLISANRPLGGPKPPKASEAIANTMPPLVAPPPAPLAASFGGLGFGASSPTAATGAASATQPAQAIPVVGAKGGASRPADGKAPMEWWERKRLGVAATQAGLGAGGSAGTPETRAVALERANAIAVSGSVGTVPGSTSPPARDSLAARLEPSDLKAATASVLADRNFLITKGTALDCALETAIDTTLPGILTCRLSRDVYSDNGQVLLLDRGTQLVGEQAGAVKQGQGRVFAIWNRAKTPAGVVISLNSPGTDALGRSGLEGWVDNHFIDRFGAAILMSIIQGAVSRYSTPSNGSGTTVYGGAPVGGAQIVEKILESTVNIPPTILKNQGDHIQVMVARDLDFSGVYALKTTP